MTNGENILSAFPNATIRKCKNKDFIYIEVEQNDKWIADFDMGWWNVEYKEPTSKNDLGVDAVNRATVLHLINDVKNSDGFKDYSQYEYLFDQVDTMPSVTIFT